MKNLVIAGKKFKNRLFIGTGKFSSSKALRSALEASKAELVTVALRRIEPGKRSDSILSAIPTSVTVMLNTSGARNAEEAVRIAEFGKAAGYKWIKLEIHPDPRYLLPDPVETLKAAGLLVKKGLIVLPYINADPVLAKRLEDVGVHAVMPLGSPIGSNQGIKTETMLRIIIEQALVPVVIDAGIGLPSHAAAAIEMGADAVLVNTAIASAEDPALMAEAFAMAVISAEKAMRAVPPASSCSASATSPMEIF
ncbi:MAG TPA: thiazole synthase [Lentisphaeria bacterium]|nr:MAG: thiazole synthase [Lentisphaerae bacterium GWF2_49_21]HBC89615.1 thiazole synthase [Lentisphaeria bacterium]